MFKKPKRVRKHFKKYHGEETPFFCETCTVVFKSSTAVKNHMENEHSIDNIVVVNNVVQNPMTSTPNPGKIQTLKIKVVNNVVQNPMTSTPNPGKIQTLKIKVRVYEIFCLQIGIFVFKKNSEVNVFPRIVSALFWKLECGKYSREEIICWFFASIHNLNQ